MKGPKADLIEQLDLVIVLGNISPFLPAPEDITLWNYQHANDVGDQLRGFSRFVNPVQLVEASPLSAGSRGDGSHDPV